MTQIVILDVDGTLVDTNYLHTEAWTRALDEAGRRVPRVAVHRQIGKGSDKLIPEFVGDEAVEEVDRQHSEIYGRMQQYGFPLPGAGELVCSLDDRGYEVWLVTSASPGELDRHLEALEISGRTSGVVSSSEAEESKPAPDSFKLALQRAGVEATEAITVGDSNLGHTGRCPGRGQSRSRPNGRGVQPGRTRECRGRCSVPRLRRAPGDWVPRERGERRKVNLVDHPDHFVVYCAGSWYMGRRRKNPKQR